MTTRVLAIAGGVGGAKLALGLQHVLPRGELAVLVNTGDDFRHLGLAISPDLDTMLYTLGGVANTTTGWGREDDTWHFIDELARIGGEAWFRLGDRDLVVHVERTRGLAAGATLAEVMADLQARFKVPSALLPMTNDHVATTLDTDMGLLEFQEYFVRHRCQPTVRAIHYRGAESAATNPAALELLASPDLECIVLCPSNPYLSMGPMLAMGALRRALADSAAPIVAVSPLIGGQAVKGPTAKIMRELGIDVSPRSIALNYAGLIDGLLIDTEDGNLAAATGVSTAVVPTLMNSLEDRMCLARDVLDYAHTLVPHRRDARHQA